MMALGILPFTAGVSHANDPQCWLEPPIRTIDSKITPDGRSRIKLLYHPASKCAYGKVEGIAGVSEVWVDRRFPYEGMLGGVHVAARDGIGGTGVWNDNGKEMRACGTSGKGTPITCTIWY